jgi:hypothetical protein
MGNAPRRKMRPARLAPPRNIIGKSSSGRKIPPLAGFLLVNNEKWMCSLTLASNPAHGRRQSRRIRFITFITSITFITKNAFYIARRPYYSAS